jgi:2-polyprenyl-3-methyl-5-hydroxy-6-metoxy-1,4-benzoquinol methylase
MDTLYRIARGFTLKWKEKIVKSNPSENSLLDFGCGTGNFLAHMKSKGWNVTGIESASEARTKASENATVYKSLDEVATQFSAITLWHVLEHIHQLNPTLKELKQRLTPSGTIFIAVPNYKSCDAEHYEKYWAAYDVPRHLWHFDRQTMTQLLSNAGFKIQQTVPMKLDAYYVSLLSESYQNPKSNSLIKYFSAILQAWKANRSASKTGEFSSLIYIAKHS